MLIRSYYMFLVFFISAIFFPSCLYKKFSKEMLAVPSNISLFLEMPQNKLVFENLSAMLYDSLWNHFDRVGYSLKATKKNCYSLKVTIKDVDSSYKFLSPDLLTYAVKAKVELLCQLFDQQGRLKAEKVFHCSSLVSRAKDYVQNSSFYDFEYKKLFERYASKIDYYFRPILLKDRETL